MHGSLGSSKATILLVDSESDMRAELRDTLESAGYLVISARDLGEAVDRLAELPPDLLIIRPYINSMPGSMAADYLRTKQHGLPVLIVAGFLENDRTKVHNEISDFHTFPGSFTRREFLAKVDEVVESIRKRPA